MKAMKNPEQYRDFITRDRKMSFDHEVAQSARGHAPKHKGAKAKAKKS
jgi:hypothetical protein